MYIFSTRVYTYQDFSAVAFSRVVDVHYFYKCVNDFIYQKYLHMYVDLIFVTWCPGLAAPSCPSVLTQIVISRQQSLSNKLKVTEPPNSLMQPTIRNNYEQAKTFK